jgi:hypothetical protein
MGNHMNYTKFLLIAALLSFVGTASAEMTGNELLAQLTSTDTTDTLQAYAYINGVLDAEDFYFTVERLSSVNLKTGKSSRFKVAHFCFGNDKVTFGQIKDIIVKYLESHPEKRHIRAHPLIRFALLEDFECAANPEKGK